MDNGATVPQKDFKKVKYMFEYCIVNHQIQKTNQASIGLSDLGLLRGYGIFDFLPVAQSTPIFVDDYIQRFKSSAQQMDLPLGYSAAEIKEMITTLIQKNKMDAGYIRLVLTGGYSENGFTPSGDTNLMILPVSPISYPTDYYERGVKLLKSEYIREFPGIKSINYVKVLLEQKRLKEYGAQDVLFTFQGKISESSRANFFIVNSKGELQTSETGVLAGITRKKILELAPEFLPTIVKDITLDDLYTAKEAFLTSTTKGTMPVRKIDELEFSLKSNSLVSQKLQEAYFSLREEYIALQNPNRVSIRK